MQDSLTADVEAINRISAIPAILSMVCEVTGLRFAAVARVTESRWVACAVRDEIEFGLKTGGELDVTTTICNEIRGSGGAVVIDHVAEDGTFVDHATPKIYGFQSYISYPIRRSNGEFFGTLCALDPLPAKLSVPKVTVVFETFTSLIAAQLDIEERLAQSRAALIDERRESELRDQFIAVLGHDLRNPLQSMTLGLEALENLGMPEKAARIVGRMQRSGARMAELIDNILDFAQGKLGGGLRLSKEPVADLQASLAHVIAEIAAGHPGRELQSHLAITRPVSCDRNRIGQLLSNLLTNAFIHGAKSGVVRVSAATDGAEFRLSVSNPGAPIPEAKRARLFEPFTRLAEGDRVEGLGLGLYIASEIATGHGGRLSVESTDETTTFTLAMPA